MITDSIGDFLTRIRNAQRAGKRFVEVQASNMHKRIVEILQDQGYIRGYKVVESSDKQGRIKIALKYDPVDNTPVIRGIQRVSKPGRRIYVGANKLPRVMNGLGIAIISTSSGVMTDKEARTKNIGGEVICYVY